MATSFGGRVCTDPADLLRSCQDQGLPTEWWGKANVYKNPLGRGPGGGAILLTGADLDALDLTKDQTLTFQDDTGSPVVLRRITLLRGRCVSPGYAGDPRAVYLCDVVDRRHFLASSPVNRSYNLKNAAGTGYLSASLNSGSAWTWTGVVQDIWTALGLGTAPSLPFTPDGTPENLHYPGGDAWEAVNDVLDRLACSVFYDPTADTFAFVRLGDTAATGAAAFTALKAQLDRDAMRLWDAYWREPDRGRLPEKVRVLFPRRPLPSDGSSEFYPVDVTLTAAAGVAAGSYVQIHDDLTALGAGTPTNAAALATRAAERAADWRRKRLGYERRLTLVYRDFRAALKPGEVVAAGALDDRGGVMATELDAGPDGAVERFRPWEPPVIASRMDGDGLGATTFGCRRTFPDYDSATCFLFKIPEAGRGRCSSVAATTSDLTGAWDADRQGWVADSTFTTAAGDTRPVFYRADDGDPAMYAETPAGGSGPAPTVPGTWVRCVTDSDGHEWHEFSFGGDLLCESGDTCGDNYFLVWVRCGPCEVTLSCGEFSLTVPRELCVTIKWEPVVGEPGHDADCPKCDTSIVARYGPVAGIAGPVWYGEVGAGACVNPNMETGGTIRAWVEPAFLSGSLFSLAVTVGAARTAYVPSWTFGCGDVGTLVTASPFSMHAPAGNSPGAGVSSCAALAGTSGYSLSVVSAADGCPPPDPPADVGCCDGSGEALELHPDLKVTVPDGPYAGDHTLTYSGGSWSVVVSAAAMHVSCSGGYWVGGVTGVSDVLATSGACSPFGLVFPGGGFGATGDVTVVIA